MTMQHAPEQTAPLRPVQRFDVDSPLEDLLDAFYTDGGFVLNEMVPLPIVTAIREAADVAAAQLTPGDTNQGMGEDGKEFVGENTTRFSSLGRLTPAYFELLENVPFKNVADAILLPHCGSYWVNTAQVMYIGPGEKQQVLHRDANNWYPHVQAAWPNPPEITVSSMIGLEHVTEELGATRAVPGSHLWEELGHWRKDLDSVPVELNPGDAFIYSGYVLHGGGANLTADRWRRAMHLSFVAGWLTPEEACAIDYTTEELQAYSPRVQRLLGHRSYDSRPHRGGGLWLKDVKAIEEA